MKNNNPPDLGSLLSVILNNPKLKKQLLGYANKLLFKRTKFKFARHLTPEDFLDAVSLKFLTGRIIWHPEKSTLVKFLFLRIRSEVANLIKKEKKFMPSPLDDLERIEEDIDGNETSLPVPKQIIFDPFEEEPDPDKVDPYKFKNLAYKLLKDSTEEYCVMDELYKGHKPRYIASKFGITENDVYNIKKRIVRVLKSIPQSKSKINKLLEVPNEFLI
jgi:hypothetical protein